MVAGVGTAGATEATGTGKGVSDWADKKSKKDMEKAYRNLRRKESDQIYMQRKEACVQKIGKIKHTTSQGKVKANKKKTAKKKLMIPIEI